VGERREMNFLKGILMMLTATVFFGTLGPAERVALENGVTPAGVSFVRAGVTALAGVLYSAFKAPHALKISVKEFFTFALTGLFGVVFVLYFSNIAFVTIPVSLTVLLFYTNPFWTIMIAAFLGKEKITAFRVVVIIVGFLGVWLAVGSPFSGDFKLSGAFFAVASGVGYSLYMVNTRYGTGQKAPLKTFVQMFIWGTVIMAAIMAVRGEIPDLGSVPPKGLLAVAHLALFPTVLSYALISMALRYIPSVVASLTSMTEIVFAGCFAYLLLGEKPTLGAVLGGTLIMGAVVAIILEDKWRRRGLPRHGSN